MSIRTFRLSTLAWLVLVPSISTAQLGSSSDRVSLPDGPGSRGGVGFNTDINLNMGQGSISVPVDVPEGFTGVTPELSLQYSSGAGNSVVGQGWSLSLPFMERMTVRGVPRYTLDDVIVADGSAELVRVPGTDPPQYRAREEGSFVRYTWHGAGTTGTQGYWTAESPDGSITTYGATDAGVDVPTSRLGPAGATFRWNAVHVKDRFGHLMEFRYTVLGGVPLCSSIRWVQEQGGAYRYEVTLEYEGREEVLSNARGGFDERLQHRLRAINVLKGSQRLRRVELAYEPYTESGGFTRLASIRRLGLDGTPHPERHAFAYTQALGGVCSGAACQDPYVVTMGMLGGTLASGNATLLDLNGDAMPDLLDTSDNTAMGRHRIWLSTMDANGNHAFAQTANISTLGIISGHALVNRSVQELDFNGDGFTDLVNVRTGEVLVNRGAGDWDRVEMLTQGMSNLPDLELDEVTADGDLRSIRFFDHDGDRRMDIIRTAGGATSIYESTGNGFVELAGVENIGWGFETHNLQMQDMNGDGLLDPMLLLPGQVSWRLNLGHGRWGPVQDIMNVPFGMSEVASVDMEDINGDGLSDLVLVTGTEVRFALNRNGTAYSSLVTVNTAEGGSIPERTSNTVVLYADMNGNGSDDIVWVQADGAVTYLELFPGRPNLVARYENGLGAVSEYTYTTSVRERARDLASGMPWLHPTPAPMVMVSRTDTYDLLSNVHEVADVLYHHGFHDGRERKFRGFALVEELVEGDAYQDSGMRVSEFDVGITVPEKHGMLLRRTHRGRGETGAVLRVEETEHALCNAADVPAGVTWVCRRSTTVTHVEGRPLSETYRVREEWDFDGHGNEVAHRKLGVVSRGDGSGCAPCNAADDGTFGAACGPTCTGDEEYTFTEYVPPTATGGRWMLSMPSRERTMATPDAMDFEERTLHYDGEAFVGLPVGQLTLGNVSRETRRKDRAGAVLATLRQRHDTHGNVVEAVDALWQPGMTDHRTTTTYDTTGLFELAQEKHLLDDAGMPYALRREYSHDLAWDLPAEQSDWMVVRNGTMTARNATSTLYDVHGRPTAVLSPGDTNPALPSTETTYDLASPVSRITERMRSVAGGAADLEVIRCQDGFGRVVQERQRIGTDTWMVGGFVVFNVNGVAVRTYQPWTSNSAACDTAPPAGTLSTTSRLDLLGRTTVEVNAAGHESRTVYLPLGVEEHDEESNHAQGIHANTPERAFKDGLDRTVRLERLMGTDRPTEVVTARYDVFGNMHRITDAAGHVRVQEFDHAGRVTRTVDPNAGTTLFAHDDMGNLVSRTDARGITVARTYDGQNRLRTVMATGDEQSRITYAYDLFVSACGNNCTHTAGKLAAVMFPVARADGTTQEGMDLTGYDARGNMVFRSRRIGTVAFDTRWERDNAERVTATVFPGNRRVATTLDGMGRTVAVDGVITSVTWAPTGELASVARANGVTDTMERDANLRPSRIRATRGATAILDLQYTRDRAGNVLSITDGGADAANRPRHDATFTHDAAYRVLTAVMAAGTTSEETLTYAYDSIDNITRLESSLGTQSRAHVGTLTYAESQPNALRMAGTRTYNTDDAGFVTTRGPSTLTWDALGRLRTESAGGTTLLSLGYSADQERVVEEEPASLAWNVSAEFKVRDGISETQVEVGEETVTILESDALAASLLGDLAPAEATGGTLSPVPDGHVTAADAWLRHAAAEGILQVGGSAVAASSNVMLRSSARRLLMEATGGALHLHADLKGSILAATAADGSVVGHHAYHPHGMDRGGTPVGPMGFEGQETSDTGLALFGYRALDTWVGRFSSVDPAFAMVDAENVDDWGQVMSGYAYAAGQFATVTDPTGLWVKANPRSAKVRIGAHRAAGRQMSAPSTSGAGAPSSAGEPPTERAPRAKTFSRKQDLSFRAAGAALSMKDKNPRAYAVLSRITKGLFGLNFSKTAAVGGLLASGARMNTWNEKGGGNRALRPLERVGATAKMAGVMLGRLALSVLGPGRTPVLRLMYGRHPVSGVRFKDIRAEKQKAKNDTLRSRYRRVD